MSEDLLRLWEAYIRWASQESIQPCSPKDFFTLIEDLGVEVVRGTIKGLRLKEGIVKRALD